MQGRFLIGGLQNEPMEPSRSQRCAFSRVFKDPAVSGNEHPSFGRGSKHLDPFQISRVSAVGKAGDILDVESAMPFVLDISIQRRRQYRCGTVIEEDLHAASLCSRVCSNSIARLTALSETS